MLQCPPLTPTLLKGGKGAPGQRPGCGPGHLEEVSKRACVLARPNTDPNP